MKKIFKNIYVVISIVSLTSFFNISNALYPDFHEAMAWNPGYVIEIEKKKPTYQIAEQLFNNYLNSGQWHQEPLIQEIIHTIWLGSALPTEQFKLFTTWVGHNPRWTHVVWTDTPSNYHLGSIVIHSFNKLHELLKTKEYKGKIIVVDVTTLPLENRTLFDGAMNYGEKSDILRYEILYNFGGIYRDTDFECLKPFDEFTHTCKFFVTIYTKSNVQNGLIGCQYHHPLLKLCIQKLNSAPVGGVVTLSKTGPIFLARTFFEYIIKNRNKTDGIVLFPLTYFYPLPHSVRLEQKSQIQKWIRPETHAIHHWHCSWM